MTQTLTENVHFSDLRRFAMSPAHYRHADPFEATISTRIGSGVHLLVLGGNAAHPCMLTDIKDRRAKAWEVFADQHPGVTLLTKPEADVSRGAAAAVLADPIAGPLIASARKEAALEWESNGIRRATGGVDLIGDGWIGDLKTARCAEPVKFAREACNLLYHAQLSDYQEACRQNGIPADVVRIIAVETAKPFPVVVFKMPQDILDLGRRIVCAWEEKLRACLDADQWPGYAQSEIEFEAPAWIDDLVGLEEE